MQTAQSRVEAALRALRAGKMVLLTDHPDRENEGDLIYPAEVVTPEIINFMIRHCSGIICLSITRAQANQLGLEDMVPPSANNSQRGTPFMVSIEAKHGITTGVSAADRAATILTAVKANATAADIVKPGHIFPLCAKEGGVLQRQGHTEGAIDLVQLAGFKPAAVLCEVMNPDGSMAKGEQLIQFAATHDLPLLSIDDLITYRLSHDNLITETVSAQLQLEQHGEFKITIFKDRYSTQEHIVLSKPPLDPQAPQLVRIHSSCITGDLFGSMRCDCKKQLDYTLAKISQEGGLLIYLQQEGRGIGLFNKIKAYALQEKGLDTVEANQQLGLPIDGRDYSIAANILRYLHISQIRLLTNNPAKVAALEKYGLTQINMVNLPIFCTEKNKHYLQVKKEKLNHFMSAIGE